MNIIRRIKKARVAKVATKNFIKAAKLAERRYTETKHTPMFVISAPDNELQLIVCNKDEFLEMRKKLGINSKDLTLSMLRRCCWYRTANKTGIDKMDPKDLMKRKMTYVHMCLESRGLLDTQE